MDSEVIILGAVAMMFMMQQSKAAPVNTYPSMMSPMPQSQQPIIIGGGMGPQMPYGYGSGAQLSPYAAPYGYNNGSTQLSPYAAQYGYNNGSAQLAQTRVTQQASVANNLINKAPSIINTIGKYWGSPADASADGASAAYDGSLLNYFAGTGGGSYADFSADALNSGFADAAIESGAEEFATDAAMEAGLDAAGMTAGLPPGTITAVVQFGPKVVDVAGGVLQDAGDVVSGAFDSVGDIFDW